MTKKRLKRLVLGGVAVLAVLLAALILWSAKPPAPPPLPSPNGYDDLVKAGRMLLPAFDYSLMDPIDLAELRALVVSNAPALRLLRIGLQRECRVPLSASQDNVKWGLGGDLSAINRLKQVLFAEGELAEREERRTDAVNAWLDSIRLGQQTSRGGLVVHMRLGLACESVGCHGLERLVPRLDAAECRAALQKLAALQSEPEPIADVWKRERIWSWRAYGLRGYAVQALAQLRQGGGIGELFGFLRGKKERQQLLINVVKTQQTKRQLLVALAAQAYELDKGRRPKSVADLVPEYLKAVPKDPVAGPNSVFQP